MVSELTGELHFVNAVGGAEGGADLVHGGLIPDSIYIAENCGGLRRKTRVHQGFPRGDLLVMAIQTHDSNHEAEGLEERRCPAGMIDERFSLSVRIDSGVGTVFSKLRTVEFFPHGLASEGVFDGSSRDAHFEIPQLLPLQGETQTR